MGIKKIGKLAALGLLLATTSYAEPKRSFEQLCDTPVEPRTCTVYVVQSTESEFMQAHASNVFSYVTQFFNQYDIHPSFIPTSSIPKISSQTELVLYLTEEQDIAKTIKTINPLYANSLERILGFAFPQFQLATATDSWIPKEIDTAYEKYNIAQEGLSKEEYAERMMASVIAHEIGHCFGLFHPKGFPIDGRLRTMGVHNLMTPKLYFFDASISPIGAELTEIQQKLVHSFLATNAAYRAFQDAQFNLETYLEQNR